MKQQFQNIPISEVKRELKWLRDASWHIPHLEDIAVGFYILRNIVLSQAKTIKKLEAELKRLKRRKLSDNG